MATEQNIQEHIEVIRNETQKHGNTRQRVADVLTELNDSKVDKLELESELSQMSDDFNFDLSKKLDKPTASGAYIVLKNPSTGAVEYSAIALTTGYIPFWISNSFQQSDLYFNGTNFGFGKIDPSEKIDVVGRIRANGLRLNNSTSSSIPGEIKFKNNIFYATGNDGLEKRILREGDLHTHSVSDIIGLQSSLDLFDISITNLQNNKADLIGGKVPSSQLPSFVDDVLEFANLASFPATGESGKIYVALNTNLTYRWSGTMYAEISPSLALGETSSTAYRGDRGKTAYDHSQTIGNPHGTTKGDIGLGNVDNTSDLNKPISTATQTELNNKQDKLTNPITGTGTVNYIPKFSATGTIENSIIYDNGNIGIGRIALGYKLEVQGNTFVLGSIYLNSSLARISAGTTTGTFDFNYNTGATGSLNFFGGTTTAVFSVTNAGNTFIKGNLGIDVLNPSEKLDVNGNVKATGFKTPSGTATQFLMADGSVNSNTYTKTDGTNASGTWGINISGNATTATTLQTTRTLTIGATGKTFNGSANVSWTLAEIGAQAAGSYAASSHTHSIADISGLQSALDGKQPTGNYLTSYTETDTLATVTARGASTNSALTFGNTNNHYHGHHYFDAYDSAGNHYPHYIAGSDGTGSILNLRMYGSGGAVKLFQLNGKNGDASWNGNTLIHSANYSSYTDPIIYRGVNQGSDFQTYQSSLGIRFDQINNTTTQSNAPGGYGYGGVLSLRGEAIGFQLWGSHTGNFYFKTQWGNDQYSGWREVLHSANYWSYAWPSQGSWKPGSLSSATRLIGITSPDGGEFGLAYSNGQIHPYTDGFFYQNEGQYRVLDQSGGNIYGTVEMNGNNIEGVNTIYANNWFRSYGVSGWYNQTYGGGLWMIDSTWVRVYGSKALLVENTIRGVDFQDDLGQSLLLASKSISGNVTIDNSYHNKIVRITASCTITIPNNLRTDFNCTFEVIGAYTAQFVDGSGATTSAPFGRYLKTDLTAMFYCTGTASNYRLNGSLTTS